MKIVSKFSDYYDGCGYSKDAATGVYIRKAEIVPCNFVNRTEGVTRLKQITNSWSMAFGLVGFCGELYPFIRYETWNDKYLSDPNIADDQRTVEFIWNIERLKELRELDLYKKARDTRQFYGSDELFIGRWYEKGDVAKKWFDKDFKNLEETRSWCNTNITYIKPADIFLDHKVPCFVIEPTPHTSRKYKPTQVFQACGQDIPKSDMSHFIILNPCLKDFKFFQVVDAFTAYQQVEMYINNQIVKPDDPYIAPVSDVTKAEAHGFNKYSFRKDKGKKVKKKNKEGSAGIFIGLIIVVAMATALVTALLTNVYERNHPQPEKVVYENK